MVPSEIVPKLRQAYGALRDYVVDINDYEGTDEDVVFEIVTLDTFVAGIADKLLRNRSISEDERRILERRQLRGSYWVLKTGESVSLLHLPEVLEYVQVIVEVQNLCLELI